MIVHLATRRGIRSLNKHMWYRPALLRRIQTIAYEDLLDRTSWPRGVYLFTDMERATAPQRGYAEWLWDEMASRPGAFLPLNHPTRHVRRFELLRRLYELGKNDFNVYRLGELDESARYPVFLRYEDRHIGSLTPLLRSRREVASALATLAATGDDLDRIIAVEYVDTVCPNGLYRKYGAFRIGDSIAPRHVFSSDHWEVKISTNNHPTRGRAEEYAYLRSNPYAEQIMATFEAAGLQYGRIDYGVKDGRIQVWEINDNPQVNSSLTMFMTKGRIGRYRLSIAAIDRAFAREESKVKDGPPVELRAERGTLWRALCTP